MTQLAREELHAADLMLAGVDEVERGVLAELSEEVLATSFPFCVVTSMALESCQLITPLVN